MNKASREATKKEITVKAEAIKNKFCSLTGSKHSEGWCMCESKISSVEEQVKAQNMTINKFIRTQTVHIE